MKNKNIFKSAGFALVLLAGMILLAIVIGAATLAVIAAISWLTLTLFPTLVAFPQWVWLVVGLLGFWVWTTFLVHGSDT